MNAQLGVSWLNKLRHEGFTDLTAEPVEPGVENVFMQLLNSNDG